MKPSRWPWVAALRPWTRQPPPSPDPTEFLHVHVDQVTGVVPFVAQLRGPGPDRDPGQPVQVPEQRDLVPAQVRPTVDAGRPAGTVCQARPPLGGEPGHPSVRGLAGHPHLRGHMRDRAIGGDPLTQQQT